MGFVGWAEPTRAFTPVFAGYGETHHRACPRERPAMGIASLNPSYSLRQRNDLLLTNSFCDSVLRLG
jgi:hypothetical protein